MTSDSDAPEQRGGWLTVYYVYTLIAATVCLMEFIGSRSPEFFLVTLLKFSVYAFAANSLKRTGTSWVAKFHIGLNAALVIAGSLAMFGYGLPYSILVPIAWPMIFYIEHPYIYPLLPLAWTIYWVVSKRVKTTYPATGTTAFGSPWIRLKDLTPDLDHWSTKAWGIAIFIATLSTLVPWYAYSSRVLLMSFANPQGERWPLIYFAYPLVLLAVWVFTYRDFVRNKLRRSRIVVAIPFALFVLSGAANLDDNVSSMYSNRAAMIQFANMERELESLEQEQEAQRKAANPEGPFTTSYDNGQVEMEGRYDADGQYEGLLTNWFRSGQKESERNFVNGESIDAIYWYENGQKEIEVNSEFRRAWLEDGELVTDLTLTADGEDDTGFVRLVDASGERRGWTYVDGIQTESKSWYASGQIRSHGSGREIERGQFESGKGWYENGQLEYEYCRLNARQNKYSLAWDESGTLTSPPYDGELVCP